MDDPSNEGGVGGVVGMDVVDLFLPHLFGCIDGFGQECDGAKEEVGTAEIVTNDSPPKMEVA